MTRQFIVQIHVWRKRPYMFLESHTFNIAAGSEMEARLKAKTMYRDLFPSGEHSVDLELLEEDELEITFVIGPAPKVEYL
jgi:hypothetical protein